MKLNRIFNSVAAVLFLVLSASASTAQGQLTQPQRELADYIKSHYTKHEVMIPMRDGVNSLRRSMSQRTPSKNIP